MEINRSEIMQIAHEGMKTMGLDFSTSQQLAWQASKMLENMIRQSDKEVNDITHTLSWSPGLKKKLAKIISQYGMKFAEKVADPKTKTGKAWLGGRSDIMPRPKATRLWI